MPETNTPLASQVIAKICEASEQKAVAQLTGLAAPVISDHITGRRHVRDNHLAAYLKALPVSQGKELLAAWLRDVLDPSIHNTIFSDNSDRIREDVASWRPQLDSSTTHMLDWLAGELVTDRELRDVFMGLLYKMGYPGTNEPSNRGSDQSVSYRDKTVPSTKYSADKLMRP